MMKRASTVSDWITILRAAEAMEFVRVVPWDNAGLWFAEWETCAPGRLHRDLVLDGDIVSTRMDEDV